MRCQRCKANIDVLKPPFGAYFCKKNHVQCGVCELTISKCICCSEDTKYKSPYFMSKTGSLSKVIEAPILHNIKFSEEEENEFQTLRRIFINGKLEELICLKNENDLNSVRTLSALIAKDLYSPVQHDTKHKDYQRERDFRFQKIMKSLHETGFQNDKQNIDSERNAENETSDKNILKLKLLYPQQSQLRASAIKFTSSNTCTSKISLKVDHKSNEDLTESSLETYKNSSLNFANLRSISCVNLTDCLPIGFPISIEPGSLDRRPFQCPVANCIGKIFVSDFNKHLIHDHPTLPLSQIKCGQFKEIFIDLKNCSRLPHCILGFLMCDIVKNFSSPPLKDILPMLLLMGRYRFQEDRDNLTAEKIESDKEPWTYLDFLVIWLVGVVPEQCAISVGISVFSKNHSTLSRWYVDNLNPIHSPTSVEGIFQRARRIVLSLREVQMLTNNFKELLHCQIGLVNYTIQEI